MYKYNLYIQYQKGDHISITRRVNDEWLKGTLNGRTGMFPISYVEVTDPLPKGSSFDQDIRKVIAVFSFKPECWEDLSIQVNNNNLFILSND